MTKKYSTESPRPCAIARELLAACKAMVKSFWGAYPDTLRRAFRKEYPNHPVCRAEAAIAKAEGCR